MAHLTKSKIRSYSMDADDKDMEKENDDDLTDMVK